MVSDNDLPQRRRFWLRRLGSLVLLFAIGFALAFGYGFLRTSRELKGAREAFAAHQLDEALERVKLALVLDPNNPDAHLLAARIYRISEKYEQAESHLEKCQAALHGSTTEELQLERLLVRVSRDDVNAFRFQVQGYVDQEKGKPYRSRVLEALAVGYLNKEDTREARRLLDMWREMEPDNPRVHYLLGKLHMRVGNYAFARPDLEEALSLAPNWDEARRVLSSALMELGLNAEALGHLERLRKANPESREILKRLSSTYRVLAASSDQPGTLWSKSREAIDEALRLDPEDIGSLYHLGLLLEDQKKYVEALEVFNRMRELHLLDPKAYQELWKCYRELGQEKEADEALAEYKRLDRHEKRLEELFEMKLRVRPNNADDLHEVGKIYAEVGKMGEALHYLNQALTVDRQHQATHRLLAEYYTKLGDRANAMNHKAMSDQR